MSHRINIGFSFTKNSWNKFCGLAKTDKRALNKSCSFEFLVNNASVNEDIVLKEGEFHAICWEYAKWPTGDGDAIDFFEDIGFKLCHECLTINCNDEEDVNVFGDDEAPYILSEEDGEISVRNVTLSANDKISLLPSLAAAFAKAAPEAAAEWKRSIGSRWSCRELDKMLEA